MSEGLGPNQEDMDFKADSGEEEGEVTFEKAVEMFLGQDDTEDGMLDEKTHIEGFVLMSSEDALQNIGSDYPDLPSSWSDCDDGQRQLIREVFGRKKAQILEQWEDQLSDSEIKLELPGKPNAVIEETEQGLEMKVTYKAA